MKKTGIAFLLIIFSLSTGLAQSSGSESETTENSPVIKFDTTTYNYGTIEYQGNGTCNFEFVNIGKEPLLLTKVRASCGCTTPSWPKEPIKPGEKGNIKVKYNTRIQGSFSKSIRVYSNAKNSPILLRVKGKVVTPDNN